MDQSTHKSTIFTNHLLSHLSQLNTSHEIAKGEAAREQNELGRKSRGVSKEHCSATMHSIRSK